MCIINSFFQNAKYPPIANKLIAVVIFNIEILPKYCIKLVSLFITPTHRRCFYVQMDTVRSQVRVKQDLVANSSLVFFTKK